MLQDNYVPAKSLGNGTTVIFSFDFALLAEANIRVYLEDATTGVQTLQTRGSAYTVTTWSRTGGTITMTTAPSSSYYVVISRDIAQTQEVNFETSSGFQGEVVEGDADKAVALVQDLSEQISRAMLYPLGSDTSLTKVLPIPSTTAGYIYYNGATYSIIDALTGTGDYPADITTGTDASKSATPSAGDIHVATDTSKIYVCFTALTWTDYNQEIIDKNVLQIQEMAQTSVASSPDYMGMSATYGTIHYGQSITPSRDMYVSRISFYHYSGSASTNKHIVLRLETDSSGEPSGTLVSGTVQVDKDIQGVANGVWVIAELGFTVKLEAGTRYWIISGRLSEGGSSTCNLGRSDTNKIAGEALKVYSGGTWGADLELSMSFKLSSFDFTPAVGDVVAQVGDDFVEGLADSEANQKTVLGLVSAITSGDYYSLIDITLAGVISGLTALSEGSLYYLDPVTEGAYTSTKPTSDGQFIKPVMIALSETTGVVINQVGVEIVPSTTDMVFYENNVVGYENEVVYNQ